MVDNSTDKVRLQLGKWADNLIDTSRRNRLLYYKASKISLELQQSAAVVSDGLADTSKGLQFFVPPDDDASSRQGSQRDIKHNEISVVHKTSAETLRSIRSLYRRTRSELVDKGLWTLYLGLGMLRWRIGQDVASSPICLFPVRLEESKPDIWRMVLTDEGDSAFNPSLKVMMESNNVLLPDFDDLQIDDYSDCIATVYDAIKALRWSIDQTAIVSPFTFHKEVIYRDLKENEDKIIDHPMIRALAGVTTEAERRAYNFSPVSEDLLDEKHPPEKQDNVVILDADSTQLQCIIAAKQGHSFVMDGPPGTGKSQTIANIIAQLLSEGKTVLFVSEKAAALDVVRNRLKRAKLDPFVLELHSHKATRKSVVKSLGDALRSIPQPMSDFGTDDRKRLQDKRKLLSAYAEAVNQVRQPSQKTFRDVVAEISCLDTGQRPVILHAPRLLQRKKETISKIEQAAEQLGYNWKSVTAGPNFVWRHLADKEASHTKQDKYRDTVQKAREALISYRQTCRTVEERQKKLLVQAASSRVLNGSIEGLEEIRLIALAQSLNDSADLADAAAQVGTRLGQKFDYIGDITEPVLETLAALGSLAETETPPQADWLEDDEHLQAAEEALHVLSGIVPSYNAQCDNLKMDFDLIMLRGLELKRIRASFANIYTGLGRFRRACRSDKAVLASATNSKRYSRDIVDRLDLLVRWQTDDISLQQAEAQHGTALGDYYRSPEGAELEQAGRALQVARDALEIAGVTISRKGAASALGRACSDQDRRAVFELSQIAKQVRGMIGDFVADPLVVPLGSMSKAVGFADAVGRYRAMAEVVEELAHIEHELSGPRKHADKTRMQLLKLFSRSYRDNIAEQLDASFQSADQVLTKLESTTDDIFIWCDFIKARELLVASDLKPVVDHCEKQIVPGGDVARTVMYAFWTHWVKLLLDSDHRLKPYNSDQRDDLRSEFADLDRQLIRNTYATVINACVRNRPQWSDSGVEIIRRQSELKKRRWSIRKLLDQAGNTAQRLKPCFMMSPLSVSQFLPPDLTFDVVIFDEASQIKPEDGTCCIYRGERVIIAGDQKQLPPSTFFERSIESDDEKIEDDKIVDDFESLLDSFKGSGIKQLSLGWHYRSRHEDLITYSNRNFYGGELQTFPGAVTDASDLGIEVFQVDGCYDRGGTSNNVVEAEKVVDRVLLHRRRHPDLSIGVVAFSVAQQHAVEAAFERRAKTRPELGGILDSEDRLDGLFVKNLETAQGDERDIIILTIGYGPDRYGKLSMNFGPLNRSGGERRLNVAVTRARRRVEIITSISADQISGTSGGAVVHLRRYLDFAQRGIEALTSVFDDLGGVADSPFEEDVIQEICAMGHEAVPQVGAAGYRIDIGVRSSERPGRYVLGVECDGASYHSAKVARDRDRLRQEILEGLGWKIYRIWSTAWFRHRRAEINKLRMAIELASEASHGDRAENDKAEPAEAVCSVEARLTEAVAEPAVEFHVTPLASRPTWAVEYVEPRLRERPTRRAQFWAPESRPLLREQITEVVQADGPIHRDDVLVVLRNEWKIGRAGSRIADAFEEVVEQLRRNRRIEYDGVCLHMPGQEVHVRVPFSEDAPSRAVARVPDVEKRRSLQLLLQDVGKSGRADLLKAWARLYGWKRIGSHIENAFEETVDALVQEGEAHGTDPLYHVK